MIATRIAFVLKTKDKPAFKLCIIGSPILGFKIGFFLINKVNIKAIAIADNTNPIDELTPIHAIEKPAKAGPTTAASCHVELLHEAALGYIFLGTIKATNEKIMGPKNARTKPPTKTKK